MSNTEPCGKCGVSVPPGSATGAVCPACMLEAGFADQDGTELFSASTDLNRNTPANWTPPTVEELQQLLPSYQISQMLGSGGMGAVFKGRQARLKRNVAIKILPEFASDDGDPFQFVERFKLEAQSMANLDHPAILSVYDFGETSDGQLYIVMEFIDGMDIQKYLDHRGGKLGREDGRTRSRSRPTFSMPSNTPTTTESFIGTSSPPTCWSTLKGASRSPTLVWPNGSTCPEATKSNRIRE